jgi:glycosyltransferase involved in cell wall biosynthesis
MRIAQIAPLTEAIPPKLYGGTERVVSWLTEELVALGHDVTLFASGDSQTSAKLEPMWPRALRLDDTVRDPMALHMAMLEQVRQRAGEFDVLHFHLDYFPFSVFSRQSTPFITTMHGRLDLPEHQTVFNFFNAVPVISISDSQRQPVPQAHWVRTIHHGLPAHLLGPRAAKPGYLAVLGRIAPEKAVDRAIRIAVRCKLPLKIAAKVDRVDRDYFERDIRPLLALPGIDYIGEIGDAQKAEFLGGSVPEVVEEGLTGFIVDNEGGAADAINNKLRRLSRRKIRARFEERFTARRMAGEYIEVYRRLMARTKRRLRTVNGAAKAASQHHDGRHQNGIDGGVYVAE